MRGLVRRSRARRALIGLLLIATSVGVARAAHEWRAAWAAPQPLWLVARRARGSDGGDLLEVEIAQPYALPGLRFQGVRVRPRRDWSLHAGTLSLAGYREWHLGVGHRRVVGRGLAVRCGLRLFGAAVGDETEPPLAAVTLLACAHPPGLPAVRLAGGIVDLHGSPRPGAPSPLLCLRVRLRRDLPGLALDHCVSPRGGSETTVGLSARFGWLCLTQVFRWGVGEGALVVELRQGPLALTIGEAWHPELGWTPHVGLSWTGTGGGA
ncbi:MAG: hypothetical protein GF330_12560 [Candidatus Eisenbacteria bacterium]|nr:hypothetical protein [Candidatus Eisenbacteria bacterium]